MKKSNSTDSRIYFSNGFFSNHIWVLAMFVFFAPMLAYGQTIERADDFKKEIKPTPSKPIGPAQLCADPNAFLFMSKSLTGTNLDVSLTGRVCNGGKADYNAPPFSRLKAVYYLYTRYPTKPDVQVPLENIFEKDIPNLQAGQCTNVATTHRLSAVAQLGVNPNLRDTIQVSKKFALKIENVSGEALTSQENCTQKNDVSETPEIIYMELWKFSK